MTEAGHSADYEETSVRAWWIVADVRRAMDKDWLAGAPVEWLACVRGHLERIDALRAEGEARLEEAARLGGEGR